MRFGLLAAAATSICVTTATESHAWKPYTHVYLAQQAWADAIDGKVTIYKIGPNGEVARDAQQRPIVLGEYAVQKRILTAIKNRPDKFFAGVLGPDAYPDIITGQMRIHPPGPTAQQVANDLHMKPDSNADGPGTDPWLQQLWAKAWELGTDDAIAWTVGFLAHAAGDVYAHTFMNTFAGGIFDLMDSAGLNWFKHITIEGYVGERTPDLTPIQIPSSGPIFRSVFDVVRDQGITGLEGFIAENTWDVRTDAGGTMFPDEAHKKLSVPYLLEQLRVAASAVERSTSTYDAGVLGHLVQYSYMASPPGIVAELAWACGGTTCPDPSFTAATCPSYYPHGTSWHTAACFGMGSGGVFAWAGVWASLAASYATAYSIEHPLALAIESWAHNAQTTIPFAMKDWVTASHNTAIHMFFTSDHLMHMDGNAFPMRETLGDGYKPFKIDMESIATGLNRSSVQSLNDFIDYVMSPYTKVKTAIGDAEKWVIDQVFQATLHMSIDQAKMCFAKPHMWFNSLLKTNTTGTAASLESANKIMRIPNVTPATCAGSSDRCTLAPSLVGTDVTGACDILASATPAKFSVRPEDSQGVFPAAFNTVNMIKLLLMEPTDVTALANRQKDRNTPTLALEMPRGAPNAPANAMLNFAATIDGSHEWLAQRGGNRMILARDCTAYRSVFLNQQPDYTVSMQRVTPGPEPKLLPNSSSPMAWEPDAVGCAPAIIDLQKPISAKILEGTLGPATVTASEAATFTLESAGKNANASALTQGALVVAPDGMSAKYLPPKWSPHGRDQIIVTSKDGSRRAVVNVTNDPPIKGGFRRELPKTPVPGKGGDPAGMRAGETAQLVGLGTGLSWTIVSGPGSVGDAKLEAVHAAALSAHAANLADKEKLLLAQRQDLHAAACKGPCRANAGQQTMVLARARITAKLDASQVQKKLDTVRATYKAPDTITRDETVTLRGVDRDGRATTVALRLLAPPIALKMKPLPATIASGKDLKLDVDHGFAAVNGVSPTIPMTWKIVSGPGAMGDATARAPHAERRQVFLAGLEPFNKRLVDARPWEMEAARQAWLDYVQANIAKVAPSFAALDEIDRTYHAPPRVRGNQRVTLRGTAEDGSGRTLDVSFDLEP